MHHLVALQISIAFYAYLQMSTIWCKPKIESDQLLSPKLSGQNQEPIGSAQHTQDQESDHLNKFFLVAGKVWCTWLCWVMYLCTYIYLCMRLLPFEEVFDASQASFLIRFFAKATRPKGIFHGKTGLHMWSVSATYCLVLANLGPQEKQGNRQFHQVMVTVFRFLQT